MVNADVLTGMWHEVSGKLKQRWGQLSDDELRSFDGNVEQLVGNIQRRTGESREAIENFLSDAAAEGKRATREFGDRIRQTASQARDSARQGYASLRDGYGDAERVVQDRPGQAMALAFGLGMAAGVGLSLWLLHERQESTTTRARASAERFGRQMLDALSNVMPRSD